VILNKNLHTGKENGFQVQNLDLPLLTVLLLLDRGLQQLFPSWLRQELCTPDREA
jgi:hypothetical protein